MTLLATRPMLAAEGLHLCIAARRHELLDEIAAEIAAMGGKKPHVVTVDLLHEDSPRKLAQEAIRSMDSVGILVNCAGGGGGKITADTAEEFWARKSASSLQARVGSPWQYCRT